MLFRSAALNAVVKAASLELGKKGVRVLALHPGWVRTDMGGPQASLTPTESVAGMRHVIDTASDLHGGYSLPPYAQLDRVLEGYVEEDRSIDELSSDGIDPDVVQRAVALIDRAEYKRRQAPPGVRLRPKAFGRDRRTPITNRWKG